ncbi:MAG: PilZ domain-containing protein [Pseudomonadales bacterium]|jgi:hypothetical protein
MSMDKRIEPRVPHEVKFFVHIQECEEDQELVGLSIECVAVDVSTRGMQFRTDLALPAKTELGITIGIGEPFSMYELYGVVRWVRPDAENNHMGVLLEERPNTDYNRWEADFDRLFPKN